MYVIIFCVKSWFSIEWFILKVYCLCGVIEKSNMEIKVFCNIIFGIWFFCFIDRYVLWFVLIFCKSLWRVFGNRFWIFVLFIVFRGKKWEDLVKVFVIINYINIILFINNYLILSYRQTIIKKYTTQTLILIYITNINY